MSAMRRGREMAYAPPKIEAIATTAGKRHVAMRARAAERALVPVALHSWCGAVRGILICWWPTRNARKMMRCDAFVEV